MEITRNFAKSHPVDDVQTHSYQNSLFYMYTLSCIRGLAHFKILIFTISSQYCYKFKFNNKIITYNNSKNSK